MNYTINDFEYLISRSKSQYAAAKGDINRAAAFMFPYLDSLDSEVDRDDSITRIADIYKIERNAVQKDYRDWKTGNSRNVEERQGDVPANLQIRRNSELCLLADVAVNMELYPEFRTAVEIKDIDDFRAKEIFIALEECFKHDEGGVDYLLARIKDDALRNFIADRGTSEEYKGNPRKIMEDGINFIRKKILEKRLTGINAEMRESERTQDTVVNIDELLAEKKFIDSQIRKLEGR
jgi:DNA primase